MLILRVGTSAPILGWLSPQNRASRTSPASRQEAIKRASAEQKIINRQSTVKKTTTQKMNFIAIILSIVQLTAAYGVTQRQAEMIAKHCNYKVCNQCDDIVNYDSSYSSKSLIRTCKILLNPASRCCNSYISPNSAFVH